MLKSLLLVLFFGELSALDHNKLIKELDKTEFDLSKLQEKIDIMDASIKGQNEAISGLELELKTREDALRSKERVLKERIRELMFFSVPDDLGFISTMHDFDNIVRGERILSKMLKNDLKEYEALKKDTDQVFSMKSMVETERTKLEEKIKEQSWVLTELKKKFEAKKTLLERLKRSHGSYQALVNRKEQGSKTIQDIALRGGSKARSRYSYKELIAPIKGSILSSFGRSWDNRIKNWVRNRGVLVDAKYGSKVLAVNDGVISFVGWIPSYGKVLIVDHNGSLFSVYGHLSRVLFEQGDKVKKGVVVAQSGDSGSAELPALYFELRTAINNVDPTPLFR